MTAPSRRLSPFAWLLLAAVAVIALAPWWRNHHYLRSFFDYGVVIGGVGRIAGSQRPYVDFISPIQTGWYVLNGLADKAGGGTYQAMTLAGAACIVVSLAVLLAMLARRWPLPWAAVVAGLIVVATASQHTILWYNSWGVVLLTVVAWAGALAPVLRWSDRGWHVLAGVALFFGGINKVNMQLMALGLGFAWAVRAGLTGRAGWGRVGATLAFYVGCAVLAVGAELAWTGATLASWWHDVIELPAAGRSGLVLAALHPDFLTRILHDYYGPQALPQGALIGLLATAATVAAILRKTWREDGWVEKILPVGCGVVAGLGGVVLLTTNMDISYIGVAGWLALLVALWLGYGLPARGPWFYGALIGPLLLVGVVAWTSAWQGQRSQFGFSSVPRREYVDGATAGPEFGYLRGTRLPPELVESLRQIAAWRRSLSADQRGRLYAGPGTEWAARLWPVWRVTGLPNYLQTGSSFSVVEETRLVRLAQSGDLCEMMVSRVQDNWSGLMENILDKNYYAQPLGPVFTAYSRIPRPAGRRPWPRGTSVDLTDSLDTITKLGGNVDGRILVFDRQPLELRPAVDGRFLLGTILPAGEVLLRAPLYRLHGVAVLDRPPGTGDGARQADFRVIIHGAIPEDARWAARLELPAGQQSVSIPFTVDAPGQPLMVWITRPEGQQDGLLAGVRELAITQAGESAGAPQVCDGRPPDDTVTPEMTASLFRGTAWRPAQLVVRGGRSGPEGLALASSGEAWFHTDGMSGEVRGRLVCPAASGHPAFVRLVWYKGGRLQVIDQLWVLPNQPRDFRVWTAEPGGWVGILVDAGRERAPATVSITGSTLTP